MHVLRAPLKMLILPMNSLLIEPNLPFDNQKLTTTVRKIALTTRLDIDITNSIDISHLANNLEGVYSKAPDTIIALGGFDWLDKIISESCRIAKSHGQSIPIFAHILPPEKLAATWRIPTYMERSLKRPLQAIAARKITTKKAYTCADTIWFTHTLKLTSSTDTGDAPTRFTVSTPQGSNLRINAPVDRLTISVHEDIVNTDKYLVSVLAEKKHSINTLKLPTNNNLFDSNMRTKHTQKDNEDIFHIQALQMTVQAPYSFSSINFAKELTHNFRIEPSKILIKMIANKNNIVKY